MTTERPERTPPDHQAAEALQTLIDRVADAVVQRLEERKKIDLIAEAVLQRIRLQAPYQEPDAEPRSSSSTGDGEG